MERPLVSVIIPIYNVENFVEKCVDSVIHQSYQDLDIVLVNDGSTDSSGEKIKKFESDSRVTVLDKENGGLSSARNKGLSVAKGDYIFFVDSDDYIIPDAIYRAVEAITINKADICCFNIAYFNNHKTIEKKYITSSGILRGDEVIVDALTGNHIKTSVWSKLYKTSIIKDNNIQFIEGLINEDIPFTILTAAKASSICYIPDVLYMAYQREGSISRCIKPESLSSISIAFNEIRNNLKTDLRLKKYSNLIEASYRKHLLFSLIQCASRVNTLQEYEVLLKESLDKGYYGVKDPLPTPHFKRHLKYIYKLSQHPNYFYSIIKFIKRFIFLP